MYKTMSKILRISENGYFRWKKTTHVVLINLLEKYFTKEDLEEFLETGKIAKQEAIKDKTAEQIISAFSKEHNEKILSQIEELKKQLI